MMKRHCEETNSNGAPAIEPATSYNTVFVDTNFDTHLALVVSDSDSVFDLKKKVAFEHLRCFPEMKELKISAVKVKRRGHYYHLSDTMLVRSVFEGIKNGWFLSVDASSCDQQLLCITYAQTEPDNHSFTEMAKEKVFDTNEPHIVHANLASSSIAKQKKVAKVIGEFKTMDEYQQLSLGAGPVAKKLHTEEGLVTDTRTSKHVIDNDASESKVVENDTNKGEREHTNMRSKNASAEPLPSDHSNKVSKLGKKKCRIVGASAEISGVQDAHCGNRNNDILDETSESGSIANKVKKLDSKERRRGSTGFNRRDVAIPDNSTEHRPIIKAALAETLEDQSLRTDTAHKKRKKKEKDSSTCHDEGVEMKIFDKLTDTTIQSGLKETVRSQKRAKLSDLNIHFHSTTTVNRASMHVKKRNEQREKDS
ncbi:PREDICTED: uncharacterized protein LOC109239029 [Nicotiana attenuata]|uniref:Uncharacterized protein n=1 Tax=Nicotiana attenuata TaxID=49451 RepID=A0A314LAL7_NICAT|nr:PREDICTED: uncharacterized protein LOC109239029 [Nicotiana attenuata]OIT38730.1 hypothetical protein A4A49_09422 [Nicotiana attenuata]